MAGCSEIAGADVATLDRQEPARTDVADVIDEHEAVAVADAARRAQLAPTQSSIPTFR